jgi:hypothetical protein
MTFRSARGDTSILLVQFQMFSKIREDVFKSSYISDVNDIGGKWKKLLNVFHIVLKNYWVEVYTCRLFLLPTFQFKL